MITMTTNLAVDVRARLPIINPIAVADVEARLGAIPPDRVLNKPGKRLRKTWVELPSIDPLRHGIYNVGAAARLVAGCTISRDSPDDSQTGVSIRALPALLQD